MGKEYKYKLPNASGQAEEQTTGNNSLIIIGANGSGKSKLGAWIEQSDSQNTHRVGAQRSLNFGEFIQLKSYEQAENIVLYGKEHLDDSTKNKGYRWGFGKEYTTKLLNDYEAVLAAMIAMKHNQNDDFIKDCKEKETKNEKHNNVPETVIDILKRIWQNIFPQRDIDFTDSKVTAVLKKSDNSTASYKGNEMSDGERVGLYLIAQCLCIPENKTIIIDEPEIHLHRSIMNRLWTEIENERKDCFFIYITHDTQFAANHKQTDKIWVKSFDGSNWDWEKINEQGSSLPEQLLLDIMGNREKVLFVEGTAGSYDTKLYSEIYKDFYVVPCGGCSSVIAQTKAMKNTPQLHDLECFGIIDRDYRNEREINALKKDNIFTINVAEVENLFLIEELLMVVNTIFSKPDSVENIKKYIIEDRFSKEINRQILESTVSELKYQLSVVYIPKDNEDAAKQELKCLKNNVDFDKIKTEQENKFNSMLNSKNYKQILSVFNQKGVAGSVGHYFGLVNQEYCDFVIRQLQGDKAKDIINAVMLYLPKEILLQSSMNHNP